MLTDCGRTDKERTAEKTEAGPAEQDAANWARGEKHEQVWGRLCASPVERSNRVNEREAAKAGERERLSGAMCRASVIWCLALSERLGETLHANSPRRGVIGGDANS